MRGRTAAVVLGVGALGAPAPGGHTRNIMLTGYWPNTNNMLRQFSTSSAQNPGGWLGGNWEGSGWNVHSFFPEFPSGPVGGDWGKGVGDFEVDYQDTSADWERIVNEVKPAAIITFSRGFAGKNWEFESRNRLLPAASWIPDYEGVLRPTEDMPIFQSLDPFEILHSSLPMESMRDAVAATGLFGPGQVYIDTSDGFGGSFLSEFIGLHGNWHHSLNSGVDAEYRSFAAGHIHVGIGVTEEEGRVATEATLRELIAHLDAVVPAPSSALVLGLGGVLAPRRRR